MRPPTRMNFSYERVPADEWIPGIIDEIKLEENRDTGFKDDKTGQPKIVDQVRFKFKLDGCDYPHYSRWMSYSYGEKTSLYTKYIDQLVEGAVPDMDFDLDALIGFPIKTMWTTKGDYDNLEQIRPLTGKFKPAEKIPF